MIKPFRKQINRIFILLCIAVIVTGICVPAYADTNVKGSAANIPAHSHIVLKGPGNSPAHPKFSTLPTTVATSTQTSTTSTAASVLCTPTFQWSVPSSVSVRPQYTAVDSSGNVYVTDDYTSSVWKFSSDGTYISKWGSAGSGNSNFNTPLGIAVNASGYVYVADTGNNRIQVFTSAGTYVTQWGSAGSGNGLFNSPQDIAVNASGYVYVADTYNNRIQEFTPAGAYVTQWGSLGTRQRPVRISDGDSGGYKGEYLCR